MTFYLKILLPIYLLLFFGLAMFWRSYIAWKRTGVNPYAFGNADTVHHSWLMGIGLSLLVVALVWVLVAQIQMGDFWRIGIDEGSTSPLVQQGPFGLSRNPIFLGMLVMLIGLLFTIPTAATLIVTLLGFVLIHIQVRLEEPFLLEKYGDAYRAYQKRVRRWL